MWLEALKRMKEDSGLTLDEIAERSGMPISTVFKVFSGQTKDPKLSTARALLAAMGYDLDDIERFDPDTRKAPVSEKPDTEAEVIDYINKFIEMFSSIGWLDESGDITDEQFKVLKGVVLLLGEVFSK